jgi:uncharacterized protein
VFAVRFPAPLEKALGLGMTPMNSMANVGKKFVLQLLRAYKWAISPMLGPACRYVPTCSEYAMEAVERYGLFAGGMKAIWRLLRCHPFAKGGYDPVAKSTHDCVAASGTGQFCSH